MQGRRIDRIEEQLRIELSEIIEREIQDPRIGLSTVTAVKVSPDLRHARVREKIAAARHIDAAGLRPNRVLQN